MSELSVGFLINTVVVGLVVQFVTYPIVDRVCKCIERTPVNRAIADQLTSNTEQLDKVIDMINHKEN